MFVGESPLEVRRVGLTDGRIRTQFDARPLHKAACRHNDFAIIPGHIPRLEPHKTVDGRALLHRLNKAAQLLFRVEADGAGDIRRHLVGSREIFIAERIEARTDEQAPLERLRNRVRRQKEPLIVVLIPVGVRAHLAADRGCGQPIFNAGNARLPPRNVAARGSQPAPGIFNERAGNDVRTHLARLLLFDKFAVAVVDEDVAFEAAISHERAHSPDLLHGKRVAELVPARTLDIHHVVVFLRERSSDCPLIGFARGSKLHHVKADLVVLQGAVALPPDDAAQRIVGRARDAEDAVARL